MRLERPPGWGILALLVVVAVNVGLLTVMGTRPAPTDEYTPQVVSADSPSDADSSAVASPSRTVEPRAEPPAPVVLAVYGDGYAAGNQQGGQGAAGWPALVADRLGARLELHALSQAGYASLSPEGQDYADLVSGSPVPDATVTVLFGSRNDLHESLASVRENALLTVSAAQQAAADDVLVVIGPVWSSADVPAELQAVRDAVRAAAESVGARFVDPLEEGWFAAPAGLIATDGVSPNDDGHRHLADRVEPVVTAALAAP